MPIIELSDANDLMIGQRVPIKIVCRRHDAIWKEFSDSWIYAGVYEDAQPGCSIVRSLLNSRNDTTCVRGM